MSRTPPVPPFPDLVRRPPKSFGWLDARLLHDEWFGLLGPERIAVMTLLAIAADRTGSSFYRRETMALALSMPQTDLNEALTRLQEIGLLANRPWTPGSPNGVWQLLPLPDRRP